MNDERLGHGDTSRGSGAECWLECVPARDGVGCDLIDEVRPIVDIVPLEAIQEFRMWDEDVSSRRSIIRRLSLVAEISLCSRVGTSSIALVHTPMHDAVS